MELQPRSPFSRAARPLSRFNVLLARGNAERTSRSTLYTSLSVSAPPPCSFFVFYKDKGWWLQRQHSNGQALFMTCCGAEEETESETRRILQPSRHQDTLKPLSHLEVKTSAGWVISIRGPGSNKVRNTHTLFLTHSAFLRSCRDEGKFFFSFIFLRC